MQAFVKPTFQIAAERLGTDLKDQIVHNWAPSLLDFAMTTSHAALSQASRNWRVTVPALIIGGGLIALNESFGPVIRDSEVGVFRGRLSHRLKLFRAGSFGLHRRLFFKEENDLADTLLQPSQSNMAFAPSQLSNERGRLRLSNFEFKITDEPAQTADGAVLSASASVTFRLNPDHALAFINFALSSFGHAFGERLKASINREIGAHDRERVIGAQKEVGGHLEDAFKSDVEGAPGRSRDAGLGVIVERVNLSVKPGAAKSAAGPSPGGDGDLISLDSLRWLYDLIRKEPDARLRQAFLDLTMQQVDARRTVEVARSVSKNGNLIIMTPDQAGLGASAATIDRLRDAGAPDPKTEAQWRPHLKEPA
ncbi:MAG: hypothetical protein AAGC77_01510 [Pseudomonadota bacterium]